MRQGVNLISMIASFVHPKGQNIACWSTASLTAVAPDVPVQIGFDERVEVAVEDRLDVAGFVLAAMVLDQGIRMQVVGTHLAAKVGLAILALEPRSLLALPL